MDTYSGKKLNLRSNGRSGGSTNLYFENGQISFEELLKIHSRSLYITETIGHGTNLVTGDYSVGANGFLVENGELKYPVSEITIAGNFNDMFKSITLANDLDCVAVDAQGTSVHITGPKTWQAAIEEQAIELF